MKTTEIPETVTLRLSREDAEHLSKFLDTFSADGANRDWHAEIDTRQFRFIRDELFLCIYPEHRAKFEEVSRIHRAMRAESGIDHTEDN
jgi:hypothetical protein